MTTPSTAPLTAEALFQQDSVIVWDWNAHVVPERYLAVGHVTEAEATVLLRTMPGDPRTVLSTRQTATVFTRHHPDTCFIAGEEARDPDFDAERGYDLCSCEAYDSEGKRWPAVASEANSTALGALPVTWIYAEPAA